MTISEIYAQYPVPPNLARHMLRVAGISQLITDHWTAPGLDTGRLVRAALLHDMGNIIKFDLDNRPELLMEEEPHVKQWKERQQAARQRYGMDEHAMTLAIATEVGADPEVLQLLSGMGFGRNVEVAACDDPHRKILNYADQRVGPFGVLSLHERLEEGNARYRQRRSDADTSRFLHLRDAALDIEHQIMAHCAITPEAITDDSIAPYVSSLPTYSI